MTGVQTCALPIWRNRRGVIVSAQFRESDGANPLRNSARLGQRYSYQEQVDDSGRRAWRFVKFLTPRDDRDIDDPAAIERALQKIFRAVQLSYLTSSLSCQLSVVSCQLPVARRFLLGNWELRTGSC